MHTKPTHVGVVRHWCQSLGVLTAVSISRHEAEMKLAAFVPLLQDRFPDEAFTMASLEHVARQCVKGFPTYPELASFLSAWWQDHRPEPARLTVDGSALQAEDRARRSAVKQSWDDATAVRGLVAKCGDNQLLLRTLARAVKLYAPQHLELLPPEVISAIENHVEPSEFVQRKNASVTARYLSREQLLRARAETL